VFDKGDLPPLALSEKARSAIAGAALLMVDGNDLDAAVEAAALARESGTTVLYDCGGLYPGVERLLALTDIMIPSEEFALAHTGEGSAEAAAERLFDTYAPRVVVITQGKRGGLVFDGKRTVRYPAYPAKVKDSNGAGDVFHGAFAFALTKGYSFEKCAHFSSAVSAIKCMGLGARESVPDFASVQAYLQQNGFLL
jgi:sulfofructose kinase